MAEIETQSSLTPSQAEGENIRNQAIFDREQENTTEEEANAQFELQKNGETIVSSEQIPEVTIEQPIDTSAFNQADILLLGAFVGASVLYGILRGKKGAAVLTVAVYMALAITQALPDLVLNVSASNMPAIQVSAFIGIFAALFYFLSRSALTRTFDGGHGSMLQTIVLSVLHAGLLLSVAMTFVPAEYLQSFSPYLRQFFIGEWQLFGWISAPIVAMIVLGRKE